MDTEQALMRLTAGSAQTKEAEALRGGQRGSGRIAMGDRLPNLLRCVFAEELSDEHDRDGVLLAELTELFLLFKNEGAEQLSDTVLALTLHTLWQRTDGPELLYAADRETLLRTAASCRERAEQLERASQPDDLAPALRPDLSAAPPELRLLHLLARQIEGWTGGQSSSVPLETAVALLESICFVLGLPPDALGQTPIPLPPGDPETLLEQGIASVQARVNRAKALWQTVCASLPPIRTAALTDSLHSIGRFFLLYNPRCLAAELPCEIDYPLSHPPDEALRGVDYLLAWLSRLHAEHRFLLRFPARALLPLYQKAGTDFLSLPLNLFAPAAANALARQLLGRDPRPLRLTADDLTSLQRLFAPQPPSVLHQTLRDAADRLCRRLSLSAPPVRALLEAEADDLAARILALRDLGGLEGIFPVTERQAGGESG